MQCNANTDAFNLPRIMILWWYQYQNPPHDTEQPHRLFHGYSSYCCPTTVFLVLQGVSLPTFCRHSFCPHAQAIEPQQSVVVCVRHDVPRHPLSFLLDPNVFLIALFSNTFNSLKARAPLTPFNQVEKLLPCIFDWLMTGDPR